jgi:hypothetical protein
MNRLTWSGIALHAGNLPGYPASHGCVRLPIEFSEKLFTVTQLGAPVIIADAATYPTTVLHPGLVLSADAQAAFNATEASMDRRTSPPPETVSGPSTSILISSAESRIVVLQDGKIVASGGATISEPSRPLGNHVYILSYVDETNRQMAWRTIGYYDNSERSLERTPADTLTRIRGSLDVVEAIRTRMSPGTTMVTVDVPLSADTRTGRDFVILADHAES